MDTSDDKPKEETPKQSEKKEQPNTQPKQPQPQQEVQTNTNTTPQNNNTSSSVQRPPQNQQQQRPPQQQSQQSGSNPFSFNLQNILKNMNVGNRVSAGPNLSSVLDDQVITKILVEDKEAQKRILPHLPEGDQNLEGIQQLLTSPQFLQAADTLHHAMAKGHLSSIARQFGIDPNKLPQKDNMLESFFTALEELSNQSGNNQNNTTNNNSDNNNNDKKDDEDDEMDEETRKAIELSLLDDN